MPFLHSGLMNFIHKNQQFEDEDIIYDQYTFIQLTHRF